MDLQNIAYAVAQLVHNFGSVAIVGGSICALALYRTGFASHRLTWIVLIGWGIQAVSGSTFGAISYFHYGKFPDIKGIALAALGVKILCTTIGFTFAASQLFVNFSIKSNRRIGFLQCGMGILALSSAAVLRWFS